MKCVRVSEDDWTWVCDCPLQAHFRELPKLEPSEDSFLGAKEEERHTMAMKTPDRERMETSLNKAAAEIANATQPPMMRSRKTGAVTPMVSLILAAAAPPGDGKSPFNLNLVPQIPWAIGKDGRLPWRLPLDLKAWFKPKTLSAPGRTMVMGRKTFESMGQLEGRRHIILTRQPDYQASGCYVVHTVEDAVRLCDPGMELMVIGGAEIYKLFLPLASRIYLTLIRGWVEADTYVDPIDPKVWKEICREEPPPNPKRPLDFAWLTLEKR